MNTGERRVMGEADVAAAEPPVAEPPEEEKMEGMKEVQEKMDEIRKKQDEEFMEKYNIKGEELITSGYVTYTAKILDGFEVTLRTLKEQEDLNVSKSMLDTQGTQHFIVETISRHVLSYAVVAINGVPFGKSEDERFEKIGEWAKAIKLSVYQEHLDLNKAVGILIKGHSGNSLEPLLIGRG